jgi:hypothetical protein
MLRHSSKILPKDSVLTNLLHKVRGWLGNSAGVRWKGVSSDYWERRYAAGGNSGAGSYGKFAAFKAEVLNGLVATQGISSVIEFGCGDGAQLKLARYPRYLGLDVSPTAVEQCRNHFPGKTTRFSLLEEYDGEEAELALSLDVIYHLVEDTVFDDYMRRLFEAATRFAVIYSSNRDDSSDTKKSHVRHRAFTRWVEEHQPQWVLRERIPNRYPFVSDNGEGSFADFYIFERMTDASDRGPRGAG